MINTTPTVGGSALSDNRAKFLPEPRIGFAYDVFGKGKTAIKASFGLHRALLDTLDYRLDQTAPFNTTLSYSNTTVDKLAALIDCDGNGRAGVAEQCAAESATPTVLSWTLKVEQEIAPRTTLTVGYVGFAWVPPDPVGGPEHAGGCGVPGMRPAPLGWLRGRCIIRRLSWPIRTWRIRPLGFRRESATITRLKWM